MAVRRDFYVYALFRSDGSVFYIGKGTGRRWTAHERYPDKSHKSNIIQKAKAELGYLPKVKLADGLSDQESRALEVDLIRLIGRRPSGPLVNLTDGGDGMANPDPEVRRRLGQARRGREVTDETRKRLSAAQIGKKLSPEFLAVIGKWNVGRKASEETREKLRKARTGRRHSEETKAKIGEAHRGRRHSPEQIEKHRAAITGRKASEETRKKLSEAHKARYRRLKLHQTTVGEGVPAMTNEVGSIIWLKV